LILAKKFMPIIAKMYTIRIKSRPIFIMLMTESIVALNKIYRDFRFANILKMRPIRMYLKTTIADPSNLSPLNLDATASDKLATTIKKSNLFQLVL
jgi:hypothetical protein